MGKDQCRLSIVLNPLQEHCLEGNTDVVSLTNELHTHRRTRSALRCTENIQQAYSVSSLNTIRSSASDIQWIQDVRRSDLEQLQLFPRPTGILCGLVMEAVQEQRAVDTYGLSSHFADPCTNLV